MRKPSFFIVMAMISLLVSTLACSLVSDFFEDDYGYTEEESYQDEPDKPVSPPSENGTSATVGACPATLDKILSTATAYEDSNSDTGEEPETIYLVTYTVSGDQISDPYFEDAPGALQNYQDDNTTHQQIWDYFTTLIPRGERDTLLAEFSIVTDGLDNNLAAVSQTASDPELWSLEVDIADSADTLNLTYTLIHEYAHLLTLGPDQVEPSTAIFNNPDDEDVYYDVSAACPDYFPGEGCSYPSSYINTYFTQFWADIHGEWQNINLIEDDDAYYEALDNFYYDYENRFLTDYAATNPEEDIAEAFTFFILSPRPAGDTIAKEKILFFYDYPELVSLREQILSGVCQLNP